jgi:hypothetical protein
VSIIKVTGSIQAAQDKAQPDDVLSLAAGSYAPFSLTKRLTVDGGGGATIEGGPHTIRVRSTGGGSTLRGLTAQGSTGQGYACLSVEGPGVTVEDVTLQQSACFGIKLIGDRLTARRVVISRVAAAVRVQNAGAGSLFEDVSASDIDRMVADTSTGNGGDAFQFVSSTGPIRVSRPRVTRARAKTVASWQYDGGGFQFYNGCRDVVIEDWVVRDSVNVMETGKDAGAPDPSGIVLRRGLAYGWAGTGQSADRSTACVGVLLRAAQGCLIEDNVFHNLDWWNLRFTGGGQYGGALGGNRIVDNDFWLRPTGDNKAYTIDGVSGFGSIGPNRVFYDATWTPWVAEVTGKGRTRSLAQFQSWTGLSVPDYWGPERRLARRRQLADRRMP